MGHKRSNVSLKTFNDGDIFLKLYIHVYIQMTYNLAAKSN